MSATETQKGGEIIGGLVSDEFLASSASVLDRNFHGGNTKGAQQWYTPEVAAKLVARVIGASTPVFDPTAGSGALLRFFDTPNSFGVEIDPDQIKASEGTYTAIQGDIQHAYTLLRRTESFDAIVMNPPFGLDWEEPTLRDGQPTNSALLTLMMALRLLDTDGQFAFIAGKGRFHKYIANKPDASGIYAVIECPDLFEGTVTEAVIAFGVHPECRKQVRRRDPEKGVVYEDTEGFEVREVPKGMLDLVGDWIIEKRNEATGSQAFYASGHLAYRKVENFKAIQTEYNKRLKERLNADATREYDVSMFGTGGTNLDIKISAFNRLVLNKLNKLHEVTRLDGSSFNYFIQNERDWNILTGLEADGLISIDPRVKEKVAAVLVDTHRVLCPLYPLQKVQRLGFLTDIETLLCTESDPAKGFDKGVRYDLRTQQIVIKTTEERPVQIKSGKNKGEWENRTFEAYRAVMQITIGHWKFTDSERDAEDIQYLLDHFELPDPGDVSTRFPEETEAMRKLLREIEEDTLVPNSTAYQEKHPDKEVVRLKTFQREDLARMLVKNDGLLAHEQGLGKTISGITFALAQMRRGCKEQVLIIAPKDLIPQWKRELERVFNKEITLIRSHGQAKQIDHDLRRGKTGWFITYPSALAIVGTRKSRPAGEIVVEERQEEKQVKGTGKNNYWRLDENGQKVPATSAEYYDETARAAGTVGYGYLPPRWQVQTRSITSKEVCPECHADRLKGWNGTFCEAGKPDGSICGYAHYGVKVKPIASFLSSTFKRGVIILDEATMIGGPANGGDSKQSKAIRGMRAKRKLAMTGTPIRNYVNQAFWPFWWSLGNKSQRFGYGYDERQKFEENFCVIEVQRGTDGKQKSRKPKPEITNLSKFWRMTASSIIRRRKEDTGEPIIPRYFFPVEVPLGKAQNKQINKWAKNFPPFFIEKHPDSNVVKAGYDIVEMMAPMLGLQQKLEYAELMPEADPDVEWNPDVTADPLGQYQNIEVSNFTPASFKALELAMALVKEGRKVLIGSPLKLTSRFIADQLNEKGVKAIHVLNNEDETANPDERAEIVYDFQSSDVDVLCTGVQAIRFGHNLDAASAVILLGFPWDFETMDQFIARVHRLTSKKPVHVYSIVAGIGTVTEKKWKLLGLKGDAASLALDGKIVKRQEFEIDKAAVIRELMEKGVAMQGDEVDEREIKTAWENFPQLADFVPHEGLLGTPPAPLPILASEVKRDLLVDLGRKFTERRIAREKLVKMQLGLAAVRQEEAAVRAAWSFFHFGAMQHEQSKAAAEAVGEFLTKLTLVPEPEAEVVPEVTKDSDPPSADLAALMQQMKEMQERLAAVEAENQALKSTPQQLNLLEVA